MIKQIEISKLYPHPDNPRLEVGDVTELAASIKENGIMQNLTVTEGGAGVPEGADGYTVVIGHRRLEAARQAGLDVLPCAVVKMSEKDQIATMLLENMQRADLTVYEQAQGMQMMLDLGETQTSISEKTGLSPATVSRRIRIAGLNKDKFKAAEARGGTIEDYLKCTEIKDEKARNRLIDKIGTNNFDLEYKSTLTDQVFKEKKPIIAKLMKKIGAQKCDNLYSWSGGYENLYKKNIRDFSADKLPKNLPESDLFYNYNYDDLIISVKRKKPVAAGTGNKLSEKEKAVRKANGELDRLSKQAFELRREFVKAFNSEKLYEKELNAWAIEILFSQMTSDIYGARPNKLYEFIGGEAKQDSHYVDRKIFKAEIEKAPAQVFLAVLLNRSGDCSEQPLFSRGYGEGMPTARGKDSTISKIYRHLIKIGYKISDEEKQALDGTHPAYKGGEKK